MSNIQDYTGYSPTWCPGCGNHGIGIALKSTLTQLGLSPSDIFVIFGIGCSGNMNDFLNAYAIHALHGRAIANTIGIKIANHQKPVVAVVGDGDCYGEGGNHFLHACRGNHDIVVIVHDNRVYGLTTGQVAPTAQKGFKSKSTPAGIIETALNPLALALTQGASFIAQAYAGDVPHLTETIKQAINHRGFSLINVLQPCVTFNKVNTFQYFQQRVYKLEDTYPKNSFDQAIKKVFEVNEEKFPLGVIYQTNRQTFTDQLSQLKGSTLLLRTRFSNFEILTREFI